jgi:hypothetical protein
VPGKPLLIIRYVVTQADIGIDVIYQRSVRV